MELDQIVRRLALAIPSIDATTAIVEVARRGPRKGLPYAPGAPTLTEPHLRDEFVAWWLEHHPGDFAPTGACLGEQPDGAKWCDIILSSVGTDWPHRPEWAIQLKRVQFVGDNGKNNDYGMPKVLSPYRKDRSMLHDAEALRKTWLESRLGVILYSFEYGPDTIAEARMRHPDAADVVENVAKVCYSNDPDGLALDLDPLLEVVDALFGLRGLARSRVEAPFAGAWRHPCGGRGRVVGWEIER